MTASMKRAITWVLALIWALFAILFALKLHHTVNHPNRNPGGALFLVSQAALGIALLVNWLVPEKA